VPRVRYLHKCHGRRRRLCAHLHRSSLFRRHWSARHRRCRRPGPLTGQVTGSTTGSAAGLDQRRPLRGQRRRPDLDSTRRLCAARSPAG